MRTTPLVQWAAVAERFDACVRETVVQVLGSTLPGDAYEQACLAPAVGGIGVRRVVAHAPDAFSASWHEAKSTCKEDWLPSASPGYVPQRAASAAVDRASFTAIVARADAREAQRLRRLDVPHANAWVAAQPSSADCRDTVMSPKVYQVAVRRLLGLPVLPVPVPCPLCQQTMDTLGDHALCRKTSDTITRHNRLRNLVFVLADQGLLAPEMEKLGILGPSDRSQRRPGDVSFKSWAANRGLAIDVAVICPLAASHLAEDEPCEEYAQHHKRARYEASFVGSSYDFVPMVFETSGAVNADGLLVLKQILRFASKRSGMGHSAFLWAWALLAAYRLQLRSRF